MEFKVPALEEYYFQKEESAEVVEGNPVGEMTSQRVAGNGLQGNSLPELPLGK